MTEPTELERDVARAIREKIRIGMHPWPEIAEWSLEAAVRAAIAECFRWRPIDTAPSHYVYDSRYQASAIIAAIDGGEIAISGDRQGWMPLPPPQDEPPQDEP